MKRSFSYPRPSRSSGFTLIELLVVIGIIAILAAVLFPAISSAINSAKRAKASTMASQIQTSALAYYTEYSVYPIPTAQTTDYVIADTSSTDGSSWATLNCVLCGNIHPSDGTAYTPSTTGPTNTRAIPFLNLKSSDVFTTGSYGTQDAPKNPLPSATAPPQNIYFNIAFDADYDNVLGGTASTLNPGLPNFATSTLNNMNTSGGVSTSGIAVWANCNGNATGKNPNFWIHTY